MPSSQREDAADGEQHERNDERVEVAFRAVAERMRAVAFLACASATEQEQSLVAGVGNRVHGLGQHRRRPSERERNELRHRDPEVGGQRRNDRARPAGGAQMYRRRCSSPRPLCSSLARAARAHPSRFRRLDSIRSFISNTDRVGEGSMPNPSARYTLAKSPSAMSWASRSNGDPLSAATVLVRTPRSPARCSAARRRPGVGLGFTFRRVAHQHDPQRHRPWRLVVERIAEHVLGRGGREQPVEQRDRAVRCLLQPAVQRWVFRIGMQLAGESLGGHPAQSARTPDHRQRRRRCRSRAASPGFTNDSLLDDTPRRWHRAGRRRAPSRRPTPPQGRAHRRPRATESRATTGWCGCAGRPCRPQA